MTKKIKILYIAMLAGNIILCGVDIWLGRYFGAFISGLSAIWVGSIYTLTTIIDDQNELIDEYRNLITELATKNTINETAESK